MLAAGCTFLAANAAWYWPFGSDDEILPPRLSELMEHASELIDEATDLAADGKTDAAADKYREALAELDRVEAENPERAATPEFATLRTKRAYVSAAIDSMLLSEAKANAKAVALSDTTELEKRFAEVRARRKVERDAEIKASETEGKPDPARAQRGRPETESQLEEFVSGERERAKKVRKAAAKSRAKRDAIARLLAMLKGEPDNRKARLALISERIQSGEFDLAKDDVERLLEDNPTDASALNLKAACEMLTGNVKEAERTLELTLVSNPNDYNGFYNMANLKLQTGGDDARKSARRYYDTGRAVGGPRDEKLEAILQ